MAPREHAYNRPPERSGSTQRALWSGIDQASIMSVELIAAILTWSGIGWLIDAWLQTMPWFLVTGALIGNAAGLYLIWLRSNRASHGWRTEPRDHMNERTPGSHGDRREEGGKGGAIQ